jgi:hypothetical protein
VGARQLPHLTVGAHLVGAAMKTIIEPFWIKTYLVFMIRQLQQGLHKANATHKPLYFQWFSHFI